MRLAPSCTHKRRRLDRAEDAYQCLDCRAWVEAPECKHGVAVDEDCDDCVAAAKRVSDPIEPAVPEFAELAVMLGVRHSDGAHLEASAVPASPPTFVGIDLVADESFTAVKVVEPGTEPAPKHRPPSRQHTQYRSRQRATVTAAMPVVMELLRDMGTAVRPFAIAVIRDIPLPIVNAAIAELHKRGRVRPGRPGTYLAVRRTRR